MKGLGTAAWALIALFAFSALSVLPVSSASAQSGTTVAGSLQVDLGTIPNATFPLDNSVTHVITVTNSGSENLTLAVQAFNSQGQGVPTYPQPGIFTIQPNEERNLSIVIDQGSGLYPEITPPPGQQLAAGNYTVPVRWVIANAHDQSDAKTFTVDYPVRALDTTRTYCEMHVVGKVTDSSGSPVGNLFMSLSSQGTASYSTGTSSDGSFSFCVPKYSGWVLSTSTNANGRAYSPDYVFVKPGVTNYDITVAPASSVARGGFNLVKQVPTHVGFWMGEASGNGSLVLLTEGMEVWGPNPDKNQSDLLLYRTDGTLVWNYSMGYQSWGASLSQDGRYAAYVTLQDSGNNVPKVGVLDASTGTPIWTETLTNSTFPDSSAIFGAGHTGHAIQISGDDRYLALGTGEGMFYLISLTTGQLLWHGYFVGQVRDALFSPDNQYVYIGTDPFLFKLDIATRAVVWEADIAGWPLIDGLSMSSDGSLIASMSKNGFATLVRTSDGAVLWQHDTGGIGQYVAISPDGSRVAADSFGGNWVYDAKTGAPLWRTLDSKDGMFSRDGNYFVGPAGSIFTADGADVQTVASTTMGPSSPGWYKVVYMNPSTTRLVVAVACCGGYQSTGLEFYSGSISVVEPGTGANATGTNSTTSGPHPTLTVAPPSGASGTVVTLTGNQLMPDHAYAYCFLSGTPPSPPNPLTPCPSGSPSFKTLLDGSIPTSPPVTLTAAGSPGMYTIEVSDTSSPFAMPAMFTITSASGVTQNTTTSTGGPSTTQQSSTGSGGGIPEFPYQVTSALALVVVLVASYASMRRRSLRPRTQTKGAVRR